MYIADLHIHSRYSMATSKFLTPEYLDLWARKKGIHILGTGDFTHPLWREELKEKLEPAEPGLYKLKPELRLSEIPSGSFDPRFIVSGEISTIYKKNGRTRKVHSLILLPGLDVADRLSGELEKIGNIHSDGRPILGLDCHDLLDITLTICPEAMYIPAHIWTPHFSVFGAFSGFDSMEECFEKLTPHIHAVETGLSSDPPMNWSVPSLSRYQLISNSDAHSPSKLGREATLLNTELSYKDIYTAIQTGNGLAGTLEFFPQEGKYFMDGHRKCEVCLTPEEAVKLKGICPVCGKKLTTGVLHRVQDLAALSVPDPSGNIQISSGKLQFENAFSTSKTAVSIPAIRRPFESISPLPELIAAAKGLSSSSVKVSRIYETLLNELGNEFFLLREAKISDIAAVSSENIADAIACLRDGKVHWNPGFDGQFGTMELVHPFRQLNSD